MPIGSVWESGSWEDTAWEEGSWADVAEETVAEFTLSLTAQYTDTLLHAEATVGERNTLYILATLTDENGEVLVDETGEVLAAFGETPVLVLHADETDTLIHAEDL
jgi:hypothetical protein